MLPIETLRACMVVPVYDHAGAIAGTVASLKSCGLHCFLVDDGSHAECAQALDAIARAESGWTTLVRLPQNRGKGIAVRTGFEAAAAAGFTHAIQVDADGQHNAADIPKLLSLAMQHPRALVTGIPVYDDSVPRARLYGRYATHIWVWINTLSLRIRDSMLGFRVYPIAPALHVWRTQPVGERMDFDTEIMVRMYWEGVDVISLPTRVTYPADGVSHFDLWRDNVRITRMHTRLFFGMLRRLPRLLWRKVASPRPLALPAKLP